MTSLLTSVKQIPANAGYYVNVGNCLTTFYANVGTNDSPSFATGPLISSMSTVSAALSTTLINAGQAVFRDHGLTLVSSTHVFRKVQLMVANTGSVLNGGTDGVKQVPGSSPVSYLTGFIELPGQGTGSGSATFTPVARLG